MKAKKSTPRREMTKMSEEKLDSPIPPADLDEKVNIKMKSSFKIYFQTPFEACIVGLYLARFITAVSW